MWKLKLTGRCILAAAVCILFSGNILAKSPYKTIPKPELHAEAAVLINTTTGDVLYRKNETRRMYPGSTTKIMTYILGLELGKNQLDEPLYISSNAVNIPDASMLDLYTTDRITLREAMRGMIIVSGCDAAVATAETVAGSESAFVSAMNQKAAALGCTGTHFVNVHGMPDYSHYTTAMDLARIAAYGMSIPEFKNTVKRSYYDMKYMDGHTRQVYSTNYFLTSGFEGADGIKTGTTDSAGPCVIVSATRNGTNVIGVILNSADRWSDAQTLMTYGFKIVDSKNKEREKSFAAAPIPEVTKVVIAENKKRKEPAAIEPAAPKVRLLQSENKKSAAEKEKAAEKKNKKNVKKSKKADVIDFIRIGTGEQENGNVPDTAREAYEQHVRNLKRAR